MANCLRCGINLQNILELSGKLYPDCLDCLCLHTALSGVQYLSAQTSAATSGFMFAVIVPGVNYYISGRGDSYWFEKKDSAITYAAGPLQISNEFQKVHGGYNGIIYTNYHAMMACHSSASPVAPPAPGRVPPHIAITQLTANQIVTSQPMTIPAGNLNLNRDSFVYKTFKPEPKEIEIHFFRKDDFVKVPAHHPSKTTLSIASLNIIKCLRVVLQGIAVIGPH
jgi:hypothetical protein